MLTHKRMLSIAPIALFVYARPEHTRRTLEALAANVLAVQSDLIVYSDGARGERDIDDVYAVRDLIRAASGFRSVTLNERATNFGLARNIIEGVTEICDRYGRVIVLEDDIVTGPHFLSFMNDALDRYVDEKAVWHISGWNYHFEPSGLGDTYFWRVMNCWGWATWSDRWKCFSKEPKRLVESWSREKIRRFNLDGTYDFWGQVTANDKGKLNTWAIFWYATIFEAGGLCLNPVRSFVRNIGNDGSGENCGKIDPFAIDQVKGRNYEFPANIEESTLAVHKVQALYKGIQVSLLQRALKQFMRLYSRDSVRQR
jgi:GR25 family glycosyltransferase involved in LPS biosynthesis